MRTPAEIAAMSPAEREAAADALLASVDLMPLCEKLVELLVDVYEGQQAEECAS